jgi:hypothetical protein
VQAAAFLSTQGLLCATLLTCAVAANVRGKGQDQSLFLQRFSSNRSFYVPLGRTAGATAPANAAQPPNAGSVVGRYSNAYFGTVEIEKRGENLVLIVGPQSQVYSLAPWDGATMIFDFVTENAPLGSRSVLTFSGLETGRSNRLEIELFGDDTPARFSRV